MHLFSLEIIIFFIYVIVNIVKYNENGSLLQYFKPFTAFLLPITSLGFLLTCQNSNLTNHEITLSDNWSVQSSAFVSESGRIISLQEYDTQDWYSTKVPATVFAALRENSLHKDVFYGKNLEAVSSVPFDTTWWYRKVFSLSKSHAEKFSRLCFDGINYRANIWLNGRQIASADTLFGAFRTFSLDVSGLLLKGNNVLAVEVVPPRPGDFTIGFVDWNPTPPDKNMGIWRPVRLRLTDAVSLNHPFVQSKLDIESLDKAEITASVEVVNHGREAVQGKLICLFESNTLEKTISINTGERKTVVFDPRDYPQLRLDNPRIWWPVNLGQPELYQMELRFELNGKISDQDKITFGIREISDYLTEEGYRGYKINGKKILIRGGGWVDDLFLADAPQKLEAQVQYVKHMNLNTIRLEGFWGSDHTLYDLCDRYGILLMTGWSCQWEWENYLGKACDDFGGISSDEDIDLGIHYWQDQIKMFRNHPSIFVWVGASDKLPRPKLEKEYLNILQKIDSTRPYLASAGGFTSKVSGPSGVKMNGPYDYVPPVYWYIDKEYGGAYGFNTETGPGPQPPPLESLKKMFPEENLWPIDDVWEFHCGRNEFNTLNTYKKAMDKRYGAPKNVYDFARTAQLMNYEAMRPMFEAFSVNKYRSTGIIQWMLNSAWPELYWQLYDYYLMPTGAFYAARKAAAPLQLIFNYGDRGIYINNDYFQKKTGLRAQIRLLDLNSNIILNEEITFEAAANSAKKIFTLSAPRNAITFIDLRLIENEKIVENNFYWLASEEDLLDFEASEWFVTPVKKYADFTALRRMPKTKVEMDYTIEAAGDKHRALVTLHNRSDKLAFFLHLNLSDQNGNSILPVFWQDNYISLLPNETREVQAVFTLKSSYGRPSVILEGWNLLTDK